MMATTAALPLQSVRAGGIPDVLRALPRWVCWRLESRGGGSSKVPYIARPGHPTKASPTNPSTWRDFETACEYAADFDGIGFALGDGVMGVDLDDCRDSATGVVRPAALSIVHRLASYTEVSPSQTGLKVFCFGSVPRRGRKKKNMPWGGALEVYSDRRYFTVTGQHLDGTPGEVEERQGEIDALYGGWFPPKPGKPSRQPTPSLPPDLDDDELVQRAMVAPATGPEFLRLWNADTTGFPSQSEADLKLSGLLAFWTNGDEARIDGLFRRSGLMRPKWDEVHFGDGRTYGAATIENAVAGQRTFYAAPENRIAYADGWLRVSRGTLLFDSRLRTIKSPARRGFFVALLFLAWPTGRWGYLGCLRDGSKGPYTVRRLEAVLGYTKSFVDRALKALEAGGLLEAHTVKGEDYRRIVDYESWVGNERELLSISWTAPPNEGAD